MLGALSDNDWNEYKIAQLRNLFFRTIQYPDAFSKDDIHNKNLIQYLLSDFAEQIGARRYPLYWKRLYSGAYMDSNKVEKNKKKVEKPKFMNLVMVQ